MLKTYHLITLGCQMNISDSQRIETKLKSLGYQSAPKDTGADLIIVNACSVRQHAVDRIWGKLKKWALLDKKQIFVTGCILKADKNKFRVRNVQTFKITELDHLDRIIKSNNIAVDEDSLDYFKILPQHSGRDLPAGRQVAYIPIMTGCDNFCSYCAVPYTRGREVSRSQNEIIAEVKDALAQGYKKILLLGQNVNSYRQSQKSKVKSQKENADFIKLLETIDSIDTDFTFNFMSSNPHDMSDELINCYAHLKKWPRELHLAMQSGDDEILHLMNRKYSSIQYLKLIENLKLKIENLVLTTDIIVGFPGETKTQFNNTVKICKKIGFSQAFIGQYSPRPGTVSAKMPDDVSAAEKKRRWQILNDLINS